ncbi:MAG: hypothetical protein AMJ64_15515 [Betaproteobacteria bacterium SG8_39]|nr:MAG: hypothetical protein AMJ64_15515 [Betaproteobacteria bacterium SG8_39]
MVVPLLAAFGLAGIVAGALALRYASRHSGRAANAAAYGIGAVLALASWFARESLAYAGEGPSGPGTVIGVPFFVAFVDASGKGGITFLTAPLALANAAFWFLLPQCALALYGMLRRKEPVT